MAHKITDADMSSCATGAFTAAAELAASTTQNTSHTGATGPDLEAIALGNLMYRVDWILIVLFGGFALFMLPRILVTISRPAHFFTLYLRRPSSGENDSTPAREYGQGKSVDNEKAMDSPDTLVDDKTDPLSSPHLAPSLRDIVPENTIGAPPRVRSWIAYTHPAMVRALNRPVWHGITLAKSAVLLVYFGLLLYAGFDNENNVFTTPIRAGFIAVSQIPIVVALATKNSVLSWFSGEGYEKLNYIHRFGGRMTVLAANLHGLAFVSKWAQAGTFHHSIQEPKFQFGMLALASLDLLLLGSLETVRRKSYTFFLFTHITGFGVLLGALYNHFPVTRNYIFAAIAVYGFDLLLRTLRTRATTAYVTSHPHLNSGSTSVHLPNLTKGFRAGQHVRVRFVNPNAGALGWIMALLFTRTRPFSISSRPGASGLELLIKKEGTSTKSLFDMAKGTSQTVNEKATGVELGRLETRRINVIVEGPYGGPSATTFEAFSGALLVAGGSGMSFILSILDDLMNKHIEGRSRTRTIEVVWSVGDLSSLVELLPTLRPLLRPRISPKGELLSVKMTVHHTRASRLLLPDTIELPDGLHVYAGRPNLLNALKTSVNRTLDATSSGGRSNAQGVIAACCGPTALGEHLNSAVGGLDYSLWKQVGGVETVTETFGW